MNTIIIASVLLSVISHALAISIAFNAGVKKERKGWQEFVKLFKKVNGL